MKKYALLLACFFAMPVQAGNSGVEAAIRSRPDLGTFYQALVSTGVLDELKESGDYTVFAPTDTAFVQIDQRTYPCFYSAQCKAEVAALLRNHIRDEKDTIARLSKWGGAGIPTIGKRELYVEEVFKNNYHVEGHKVLSGDEADGSLVYRIDGIISDDEEMEPFKTLKTAERPAPGAAVPGGAPGTPMPVASPTTAPDPESAD